MDGVMCAIFLALIIVAAEILIEESVMQVW